MSFYSFLLQCCHGAQICRLSVNSFKLPRCLHLGLSKKYESIMRVYSCSWPSHLHLQHLGSRKTFLVASFGRCAHITMSDYYYIVHKFFLERKLYQYCGFIKNGSSLGTCYYVCTPTDILYSFIAVQYLRFNCCSVSYRYEYSLLNYFKESSFRLGPYL